MELPKGYIEKFKVTPNKTLFEPLWDNLWMERPRCPLCSNLLKFPIKGKVAICNSVKHKPFIISKDKL